jgi:hypothetical protein
VTREELDQCFATLVAAWPHFDPNPQTFELAERLLMPLPFAVVGAAIAEFALTGREFAPPIGLLARRSHELAAEARGDHLPDADEALTEVYEQLARVGIYRTPTWSHPAIAATIAAFGGWEQVCLNDNPEAFRAHFMRLYDMSRQRAVMPSLLASAPPSELVAGPVTLPDLRADRALDQ